MTILLQISIHSPQIYTRGPATNFRTCSFGLPQKLHFSRRFPSPNQNILLPPTSTVRRRRGRPRTLRMTMIYNTVFRRSLGGQHKKSCSMPLRMLRQSDLHATRFIYTASSAWPGPQSSSF